MSKRIIPECFAETFLIKHLGFSKPNHSPSVGKVLKKIRNNDNSGPLIGVIDNDLSKPNNFAEYDQIIPFKKSKSSIKYYKHKHLENYIIQQDPDFESWIYQIAKSYNLIDKNSKFQKVKDLKEVTKQKAVRINRDKEFNRLLENISSLQDSPFNEIKSFINSVLNNSKNQSK